MTIKQQTLICSSHCKYFFSSLTIFSSASLIDFQTDWRQTSFNELFLLQNQYYVITLLQNWNTAEQKKLNLCTSLIAIALEILANRKGFFSSSNAWYLARMSYITSLRWVVPKSIRDVIHIPFKHPKCLLLFKKCHPLTKIYWNGFNRSNQIKESLDIKACHLIESTYQMRSRDTKYFSLPTRELKCMQILLIHKKAGRHFNANITENRSFIIQLTNVRIGPASCLQDWHTVGEFDMPIDSHTRDWVNLTRQECQTTGKILYFNLFSTTLAIRPMSLLYI